MITFKTYISCPIIVSKEILDLFVSAARSINPTHTSTNYWDRRETYYHEQCIRNCDAFILILPGNKFKYLGSDLPPGCKKELNLAIDYQKAIYIGYMADSQPKFYRATIKNNFIEGIGGTSGYLAESVKLWVDGRKYVEKESQKTENFCGSTSSATMMSLPTYDRRLLLLL